MDSANHFQVVRRGDTIAFTPQAGGAHLGYTRAQVLNLVAWLIVMAEIEKPELNQLVTEIQET